MKERNTGFSMYLLFQILIAISILGIVTDYVLGQKLVKSGMMAGVMILTAVYLGFGAWYLWRKIYAPLEQLEAFSRNWADMEDPEAALKRLPGMIGGVASVIQGRMEELDRNTAALKQSAEEHSEDHIRAELLGDICRSTLPRDAASPEKKQLFAVGGVMEEPGHGACCFYDYFLLQPELLCVMAGEVLGREIADALFLTSAHTTLRNCLHTCPTLEEAVGSANTQLYTMGGERSLRVLVGTLNLKNGQFSYVNAGGPQPLVMRRSQARYTLLDFPAYDAMGQYQQVGYRPMEVRLRQGDRIFLSTSGLGQAVNREGMAFAERGLRTALNRSGRNGGTLPEMLRGVADEAVAWVGARSALPGFSALLLEYLRGRADLPGVELPNDPASLPKLLAFIQKECQDNGLRGQNYTRLAVMVEELFTLCCRYSRGPVRTECAVTPNGDSVNIRMSGDMSGRNPLENSEDMTAENAAEFIFAYADYTQFQSENGEDSITMACFME